MKKLVLSAAFMVVSIAIFAQVGIGTSNPKGALDVNSETLGLIIPRVPDFTLVTATDGTAPVNGTFVYDTNLKQLMIYIDGSWLTMGKNTAGDAVVLGVVPPPPPPAIGDAYQGGIVAYILQASDPGYVSGETHGLIAAINDQTVVNVGIAWITGGSTQTTLNGNTSAAIGAGQANTTAMMNQAGYTGGAAKLCDDYSIIEGGVTYDDWFLPSKDELNLMYANRVAIGGFDLSVTSPIFSRYWSSTHFVISVSSAWVQYFRNPTIQDVNPKSSTIYVRAVRAF